MRKTRMGPVGIADADASLLDVDDPNLTALTVTITNLLDGKPVPLYGDGLHVREWLHVTDHCAGVQLVAERGRTGEVYHVGGGTPLTDAPVCEAVLSLLRMVDHPGDSLARYHVARSPLGLSVPAIAGP